MPVGRKRTNKNHQIQALLARTWHIQKREHCLNFCNFVVPGLFLILLSVLARVIKSRDVVAEPFEKDPRGAFVAHPFRPDSCLKLLSKLPAEEALRRCRADPFVPKWTVPTQFSTDQSEVVGRRNATLPQSSSANTGILSHLSLEPYIYPPAVPGSGDPFEQSQTEYDGVFLYSIFDGNTSHPLYSLFVEESKRPGVIDSRYQVSSLTIPTVPGSSTQPIWTFLFDSWFKGEFFGKYFGAYLFDRAVSTSNDLDIGATVFYNNSEEQKCTEACQLTSNVIHLERAIYKSVSPNKSANAFLRRMPLIDSQRDLGIMRLAISTLLGTTFHFLFPLIMRILVMERQDRLRALMGMMGVTRARYWIGSYLGFYIQYLLTMIVVLIVGFAARVRFFLDNTPVSYLVLFLLW